MDIKQLLEFAGLDTSKGKAKALIEQMGNKGLMVWLDEGEMLVELTDMPANTSDEVMSDKLYNALSSYSPELAEFIFDQYTDEGRVVDSSEQSVAQEHMKLGRVARMTFQQLVQHIIKKHGSNVGS